MRPEKTEALRAVAAAQSFLVQAKSLSPHCEPSAGQSQEPYGKRLIRLCAEFASVGWQMHPLQAGSVIVAFMGAHRVLGDLDAAERMLARIKGSTHG